MPRKIHRLGINEANLVRRKIKLLQRDKEVVSPAVHEIDTIYGVDDVRFNPDSGRLTLEYDATRLNLDCVEEVLDRHGLEEDQGWWSRYRRSHYRFVDENIKDSALHEPFSCHRIPRTDSRIARGNRTAGPSRTRKSVQFPTYRD